MKVKLTSKVQQKWIHNTLKFLRPVALIYLISVIGIVSNVSHVFTINDLIPNTFVTGGVTLYFLNVAYDYFNKLRG